MKKLTLSLLLCTSVLTALSLPAAAAQPTCSGLPATIVGTNGDDFISGTAGADVIVAFAGDDRVWGAGGNDTICGGPGDDSLGGWKGDDTIYGGTGDDAITGDEGRDVIRGGPGNDRISGDHDGGGGDFVGTDDVIFGGDGRDIIKAGPGNDVISGGAGGDKIFGQFGDDRLLGHGGNDILAGGAGTDTAIGHRGADLCSAESVDCESLIPEVSPIEISKDQGDVAVSGTATHVEPIVAVEYAVRETASYHWLQPDGSFAPLKVWHSGALDDPGGLDITWSSEFTLRRGEYVILWRAIDGDGEIGQPENARWFSIRLLGFEFGVIASDRLGVEQPWTWEGLVPLPAGSTLGSAPRDHRGNPIPTDGTGRTVRTSGAAFSTLVQMLGFVEIALADDATAMWLQEDGTFTAAKEYHLADCPACFNSPTAYWFFDAELPDGDYTIHARSEAGIGIIDDASWSFSVSNAVAAEPSLTIDQTDGVVTDTATFTGTAMDDLGVLTVRFSIRSRDTGLWLSRGDHWSSSRTHLLAELADPNAPFTEWMIERDLPPGRYVLIVEVLDQVLHLDQLPDWVRFTITE